MALVAAVLLATVGCQREPAGPEFDGFWLTAPQTDQQRVELLRRARNIDPCALIPRAALGETGPVDTVFSAGPQTCEAKVGVSDTSLGRLVRWWLSGPKSTPVTDKGVTKQIDGVTVLLSNNLDADPEWQPNPRVATTCTVSARFPSTIGLALSVDMPAGTDPCVAGESLIRTALSEWKNEPQQGVSPDTSKTVLTGADPCAVVPRLGVSESVGDVHLEQCSFRFQGDDIRLDYEYESEDLVTSDDSYTIGDRPIYRKAVQGFLFYDAPVGPAVKGSGGQYRSPLVPVIALSGTNQAALDEVMRQTQALLG
ncbi:hypothetical protein [Nocardia sp. NPDC051832]|uniref:hypothetical protein n=1 Tax=Nocardia sp. NPDC051832 TaxID=3155673 RepID=UPI00341A7B8F